MKQRELDTIAQRQMNARSAAAAARFERHQAFELDGQPSEVFEVRALGDTALAAVNREPSIGADVTELATGALSGGFIAAAAPVAEVPRYQTRELSASLASEQPTAENNPVMSAAQWDNSAEKELLLAKARMATQKAFDLAA
jgi:hypothetical protein